MRIVSNVLTDPLTSDSYGLFLVLCAIGRDSDPVRGRDRNSTADGQPPGLSAWPPSPFSEGKGGTGGFDGYARRFGNRMASRAIRESIRLGADIALGTDSRYDLCNCDSAKGRLAHAWKRVVVTRKDAGSDTIAVSNMTGAFATPWITHTWLPDRYNTTSAKLQSGAVTLAFWGLGNTLREFWPDIAKKTHMPRKFGGGTR
jgi:hypothetical protein